MKIIRNIREENTSRFRKLKRNKFMLFWCRFFVELNALQAIITLFYLHRGLSLPEIFYLGIAWSVASIIFDIPTSFLADKWGRKNTIIIGVVINILTNFALYYSFGYFAFLINTFFMSLSFSFFSGVEDAFIFDTLKEMKQEGLVLKTSGKYAIASKASKMVTPLVGVLIASSLTAIQFNVLISINFISSCLALYFALSLVEPKKLITSSLSRLQLIKDSFATLWSSKILKTITFNKTLIFIGSFIFWKFYQKSLTDMGISVFMLGLLYPINNTLIILIFSKTQHIFNKVNKSLIFNLPVWLTLIGSLIFVFSQNRWLSYMITTLLIIIGVIRDPFFNQQIQWRLKSQNRATTSSVMGLLKSLLDIPILLLSGYLASLSSQAIMLVPIVLSLVALIFFRIKKEDILLEPI